MDRMRHAIACCESALSSSESGVAEINIRNAKRAYADALRVAGPLRFTVRDVRAFEFSSIRLEHVIAKLELRYIRERAQREQRMVR